MAHKSHHVHHVDCRLGPCRSLSPFGSTILEPNLHSGLVQAKSVGQLFARVRVRVGRLLERGLKHAQLVGVEHGPVYLVCVVVVVVSGLAC